MSTKKIDPAAKIDDVPGNVQDTDKKLSVKDVLDNVQKTAKECSINDKHISAFHDMWRGAENADGRDGDVRDVRKPFGHDGEPGGPLKHPHLFMKAVLHDLLEAADANAGQVNLIYEWEFARSIGVYDGVYNDVGSPTIQGNIRCRMEDAVLAAKESNTPFPRTWWEHVFAAFLQTQHLMLQIDPIFIETQMIPRFRVFYGILMLATEKDQFRGADVPHGFRASLEEIQDKLTSQENPNPMSPDAAFGLLAMYDHRANYFEKLKLSNTGSTSD